MLLAKGWGRFQDAVFLHRSGRVDRAMEIYRALLEVDANHAGAWHLLGVALNQQGHALAALVHIERALSHCDSKAVYWNNY